MILFPLIVPYINLVYFLVKEKELKIKETMKIMGLQDMSYFLSYIIQYCFIYLIISIIVMVFCKIFMFQNSNLFLLIIFHYSYCLTLIGKAYLVASFNATTKSGIIYSFLVWFFEVSMFFSVFKSFDFSE